MTGDCEFGIEEGAIRGLGLGSEVASWSGRDLSTALRSGRDDKRGGRSVATQGGGRAGHLWIGGKLV